MRRPPVDLAFPASSAFILLGLNLTASGLRMIALYVICLVVATAIHEFAHAFAADRLGDPTPGRDGRLTLNPLVHADPIGTVALPAIAGATGAPLFGWGRPVMTQSRFYTRKISMRAGLALVAVAGPLSNLLQAAVTLGVVKVLVLAGITPRTHDGLYDVLQLFFTLNLVLAALNLLPIHPLDGGKILSWALPARFDYVDDFLARYGWVIFLALIMIPGLLAPVFDPVYRFSAAAFRLVGA